MTRFFAHKPALTVLVLSLAVLLILPSAFAQETTAGIQGTVKDSTGAVVSKATVEVTSPALIGVKKGDTDTAGYYHFSNLPPGEYTITVTAPNFKTYKQSGITLDVGRLPSIDITLQVGAVAETVEVTGAAPLVDVTQSKVQTNLSEDVVAAVPKGRSFQSLIQFAPGARNEPLQGGYQIDGASNSENSYLVEGQETAAIQTGASNTNVPMEFIQEVQISSSGFEAEHGGALGGVVNVVQKRGSNDWHGSVFTYYQGNAFDSAPNRTLRRDPTTRTNGRFDQLAQYYQPKKDHYRIWEPGFELGGYVAKNRLWLFASTVPRIYNLQRTVRFDNLFPATPGAPTPGNRTLPYNVQTYYSLARVDFLATQKIRLFGSWNYGYQRGTGTALPGADDVFGARNLAAGDNPDNYNSGIGYRQPNTIYGTGADMTLTPALVATTRFGYQMQNYNDVGKPIGIRYYYRDTTYNYGTTLAPAPATLQNLCAKTGATCPVTTLGAAAPNLVQSSGWSNISDNTNTTFDKYTRTSLTQDLAYFKKAFGTHNLKFGYAMNRLKNDVFTGYNTADVYVAFGRPYFPSLTSPATGGGRLGPGQHCADVRAENIALYGIAGTNTDDSCIGLWGTVNIRDLGTSGAVSSNNHGLYVQDAWTVGRGITLNLGVRMDKEDLPSYNPANKGISFGFTDKLAPRLGGSWDVKGNGKLKVYGSFGYFYDIMKYEMPRGSFGGDWWHDCAYTLDSPFFSVGFVPQRSGDGNHYCPGTGGANGTVTGGRFIANEDFRMPSNDANAAIDPVTGNPRSAVDPHLKPMKQHEMVLGADWALAPTLALETRYSRKRLDRTIEDAGVLTPFGEQYYIVNPGFGDNAITCTGCPANPKANRRYDGIEFRLTKRGGGKWFGAASYTYSRFYGNYTGLTATDISDGGAGRNSPNVDRSFDEPYMSFDSSGHVIDGPLPTDRPNTFKAYGYRRIKWWKMETTLGAFQQVYSGTPLTSYVGVYGAPVFTNGRGQFVNLTQDATGNWVVNGASAKRTPKFSSTDFSLMHELHVNKNNERQVLGFEANITNLFNQHSPTYFQSSMVRSGNVNPPAGPGGLYKTLETGYNWLAQANTAGAIKSSLYGMPYGWQDPRSMRFKMRFSF